jgi:hypothetical protein
VTLHRPPPEIFTLAKGWRVFSKILIFKEGFSSEAIAAEKQPAAPAPIMTMSCVLMKKLFVSKEFIIKNKRK